MMLWNKARNKIKQYFLRRRVKRDPTEETARKIERKLESLYWETKSLRVTLSRQDIIEALELTSTDSYQEPFERVLAIAYYLINDHYIYTLEHESEEICVRRMYSSITLRSNGIDFFITEQYAAALDKIQRHPFVF